MTRTLTRILPILLALLALIPIATAISSRTPDAVPGTPVSVRGTLTVGEEERTYDLYVPGSVANAAAVPLLIALHPFASSGTAWHVLTGFDMFAERDGFIVVYPDAYDMDWNDGSYDDAGWVNITPGDDNGFLVALVDHLAEEYPVDRNRVYLAGFGAGGTYAYRAACEIPGLFDKIAVVGSLMWEYQMELCAAAPDPDPTDVLVLLGDQDGDYSPEGRMTDTPNGPARIYSFEDTVNFWAERYACDAATAQFVAEPFTVVYDECAPGAAVAAHLMPGVGHNWPRLGDDYALNQFGFDMSAILTDYFLHDDDVFARITPEVDTANLYKGTPRTYTLYVPSIYDPAESMPLVIALHGRPGTATGMAYIMDSNWVAEREGFMLLYPDGMPVAIPGYDSIGREWNYGYQIPGYQDPEHPELYQTDDVEFLQLLVDDLARDLNIDRTRVYVTGFSNGGFMTQRVACEAGDAFAAYVVAGATMIPEFIDEYCDNVPPVPIMYMHGTKDTSVAWDGTMLQGRVITMSAPDSVLYWVGHNQCDPDETNLEILPAAEPDPETEVYHYTFGGCANGADVWFYVIEGGGHSLPGVERLDDDIARATNMDIHVGEAWWGFLSRYALEAEQPAEVPVLRP